MGIVCQKISYRAKIEAKKGKDNDALQECIQWRKGEHEKELIKKRQEEEKKRIEQLRKEADKQEKQR